MTTHKKGFCCIKGCNYAADKTYMSRQLCWLHYLIFKRKQYSQQEKEMTK